MKNNNQKMQNQNQFQLNQEKEDGGKAEKVSDAEIDSILNESRERRGKPAIENPDKEIDDILDESRERRRW